MVNLAHSGLLDTVLRHLPKNVQRECRGKRRRRVTRRGATRQGLCILRCPGALPRTWGSGKLQPRLWRQEWEVRVAAFNKEKVTVYSGPNLAPIFKALLITAIFE